MVSDILALSLDGSYWVVAEIASLNEHSSGHCYLDLVQKPDPAAHRYATRGVSSSSSAGGGLFIAQARATAWRNAWAQIKPKFQRATHQSLSRGMKVLVEVRVTFHEVYGYALNILDIDPTYTMGEMARQRQAIIDQLTDEGVIDLNKELPLPRPLQRIAVISAAGAAGYGDFSKQLSESGYRFVTRLFPATMQGADVEPTVLAALDAVAAESDRWDCVVIIRGGGAVSDLDGFETYLLAASIAQFPLPVFTGIGHDRDETVLDLVAHTRLKTPTAVAQFLIDKMHAELDRLFDLRDRLSSSTLARLAASRQHYDALAHRFERATSGFTVRQREHLMQLSVRLDHTLQRHLDRQRQALQSLDSRLLPAVQRLLERHHHRITLAAQTLKMAGPERILRMGYSITTTAEGRVIRSIADALPGTLIKTTLADGTIMSEVKE